jgi:hypothetical protein
MSPNTTPINPVGKRTDDRVLCGAELIHWHRRGALPVRGVHFKKAAVAWGKQALCSQAGILLSLARNQDPCPPTVTRRTNAVGGHSGMSDLTHRQ